MGAKADEKPEIEITPEMVAAGVQVMCDLNYFKQKPTLAEIGEVRYLLEAALAARGPLPSK